MKVTFKLLLLFYLLIAAVDVPVCNFTLNIF